MENSKYNKNTGKYYGQLERLVEHKENIVDVRKDRTKKTVKTMDIGKNYGHT